MKFKFKFKMFSTFAHNSMSKKLKLCFSITHHPPGAYPSPHIPLLKSLLRTSLPVHPHKEYFQGLVGGDISSIEAFDGSTLIGHIGFGPRVVDGEDVEVVYVYCLAVDVMRRSNGVGRELLKLCVGNEEECALHVLEKDGEVMRFYEKHGGFMAERVVQGYYPRVGDAVFMRRKRRGDAEEDYEKVVS